MAKILIAEDDPNLGASVRDYLTAQAHTVDWAVDGKDAAERLRCYKYDLLVVDWEMPHKSGLEVIAEFRDRGGTMPVLFLTGKGGIGDKVSGLDAGADDFMTKPFSFDELAARVRALVRRPSGAGTSILTAGAFIMDTARRTARFEDELIHLAPREYALVEFLLRNRGNVFSNEALLDRVWDSSSDASPDTVRFTINRIRRKLGADGDTNLIRNVFGSGYTID